MPANDSDYTIVNWNVRNPAPDRARRQASWIARRRPDLAVLTEMKMGGGRTVFAADLQSCGYHVLMPAEGNGYLVLLASLSPFGRVSHWKVDTLPARLVAGTVQTTHGRLLVVGLYVPSRGTHTRKNVDKRIFQAEFSRVLRRFTGERSSDTYLIAGDLNVVSPTDRPRHAVFGPWEYRFYNQFARCGLVDCYRASKPGVRGHSWLGRSGRGYRFDHVFVSSRLTAYIRDARFLHCVRRRGLSDHAAMIVRLGSARRLMPNEFEEAAPC